MQERYVDVFWSISYLEEILGAAWLKEMLKLLKAHGNGGGSFGRGIDFSACGVPPVAYYWYRAREEVALAGIRGDGNCGIHALHTAVIACDLLALAESDGVTDRVEGLKDPARASIIQYELCVASGYARKGCQVVFRKQDGLFVTAIGPGISVRVTCASNSGDGHVDAPGVNGSRLVNRQEDNRAAGIDVMYIYAEETLHAREGRLHNRQNPGNGEQAGVPLVVFSVTPRFSNRMPAIIRSGKLVNPTSGITPELKDIYIPCEKVMQARC